MRNPSRYTYCKIKLWITNFRKTQKCKIVVLLVTILLCIVSIFPKEQNLKIHFIDVGQGDASLIVTPKGKTVLIDGGGSENMESYDVGESVLVPYLLDRKITTIDYLVVSHFHADHCNGLLAVLEKLKVHHIVMVKQTTTCKEYENFMQKAKQEKSKIHIVNHGDNILVDSAIRLEVIQAGINSENLNNTSMIAKIVYGNFSMLFTGDAEIPEEQVVLDGKFKERLRANVLKVGHHGSTTSTSTDFLEAVSPQIALIGVGQDNKFGHPKADTLDKLESKKVNVYRTDLCGEITIEVNKNGKMKVKTRY